MSNNITNQLEILTNFFNEKMIDYLLINHESGGKCDEVSEIRGTEVGQGAKALVCKIKEITSPQYLLAVIPGDRQLDFKKLALQIGVKKITLANVDEVYDLTNCVPGAVPPFSFHENLKLVADPSLFQRYEEIAFNAGSLIASVKLKSKDYLNITTPLLLDIIKS